MKMEARLPQDKLEAAITLVKSFSHRKKGYFAGLTKTSRNSVAKLSSLAGLFCDDYMI